MATARVALAAIRAARSVSCGGPIPSGGDESPLAPRSIFPENISTAMIMCATTSALFHASQALCVSQSAGDRPLKYSSSRADSELTSAASSSDVAICLPPIIIPSPRGRGLG